MKGNKYKSWRYTPLGFDILNLRVRKRNSEGREVNRALFLFWAGVEWEGNVESE